MDQDAPRSAGGSQDAVTRGPQRRVLVLLDPGEPLMQVVGAAARRADAEHAALVIAVLTAGRHVGAPCMAALDTALQLARAVAPRVCVRVDTTSPGEVAAHVLASDLVMVTPTTWSKVPRGVRAAHLDRGLVEVVGSGSVAGPGHRKHAR